jgi:hypothetical protein
MPQCGTTGKSKGGSQMLRCVSQHDCGVGQVHSIVDPGRFMVTDCMQQAVAWVRLEVRREEPSGVDSVEAEDVAKLARSDVSTRRCHLASSIWWRCCSTPRGRTVPVRGQPRIWRWCSAVLPYGVIGPGASMRRFGRNADCRGGGIYRYV